jgi:hypothetical protein
MILESESITDINDKTCETSLSGSFELIGDVMQEALKQENSDHEMVEVLAKMINADTTGEFLNNLRRRVVVGYVMDFLTVRFESYSSTSKDITT